MAEHIDEIDGSLREAWGIEAGAPFPPASLRRFGLRWTAFEPKKTLHATAVFPPDSAGPFAVVENGQALAAFEAVALVFASLLAHKRCITLTIEGAFLRQLPCDGEHVAIETHIRATRKSIVFVEGSIKGADGKLALHASATFAALKHGATGAVE